MRIRTLDSVRGAAALIVLFEHCYSTFPEALRNIGIPHTLSGWESPWPWLRYSPFHLLIAGQAAVMVFFVLSGFVLTLPFVSGTQPAYPRYLIKRFCRIWLPFAFAILLSALLYKLVAPVPIPSLSIWFNQESWSRPIGVRDIVDHLAMTGFWKDRILDNAMWSLVHELRISIIFPLLVVAVRAGTVRALLAAFVLFGACEVVLLYVSEETFAGTILATGQFIICFVVGIALALELPRWRPALLSLRGSPRLALWLLAFAALAFPASRPDVARFVWTLGAAGAIMLCLASPLAERLLHAAAFQWLGRVSYSLYLVHLLILLTAVHLLSGRLPLAVILLGVIVVSLASADAMYRWIEKPAMQLGRRLTAAPPPLSVALAADGD